MDLFCAGKTDYMHHIGNLLTKPSGLQVLLKVGERIENPSHFATCVLRLACKFGRLFELQSAAVSFIVSNTEEKELLFRTGGFASNLLVKLCTDAVEDSLKHFLTGLLNNTSTKDLSSQATLVSNSFSSRSDIANSSTITDIYREKAEAIENIATWTKDLFFGLCLLVKKSALGTLCRIIFGKTNEAFSLHHPYAGVVGLVFLCTFCPIITSPEKILGNQLSSTSIDSSTRSLLILASKLIQKLVNHAEFDLSQPHLVPFNKILLSAPDIREYENQFFTTLTTGVGSIGAVHSAKKYEAKLASQWEINDTRECWQALLLYPREELSCISLGQELDTFCSFNFHESNSKEKEKKKEKKEQTSSFPTVSTKATRSPLVSMRRLRSISINGKQNSKQSIDGSGSGDDGDGGDGGCSNGNSCYSSCSSISSCSSNSSNTSKRTSISDTGITTLGNKHFGSAGRSKPYFVRLPNKKKRQPRSAPDLHQLTRKDNIINQELYVPKKKVEIKEEKERKKKDKQKEEYKQNENKQKKENKNGFSDLSRLPQYWTVEEIAYWLDSIDLSEHQKRFKEECIDGAALLELNDADLFLLDVHKLGHRMRIKRGIFSLSERESKTGT